MRFEMAFCSVAQHRCAIVLACQVKTLRSTDWSEAPGAAQGVAGPEHTAEAPGTRVTAYSGSDVEKNLRSRFDHISTPVRCHERSETGARLFDRALQDIRRLEQAL
jgi:hypothetical protein